jgi:hypothetical protein
VDPSVVTHGSVGEERKGNSANDVQKKGDYPGLTEIARFSGGVGQSLGILSSR